MGWKEGAGKEFIRLLEIIEKLRSPEGCPWDRKQTPHTLRKDLIEETYECIEAIENKDYEHTKEELGDLYLLTTMITYMHHQEQLFEQKSPLKEIGDKLIRRHPHVFGEEKVDSVEEVLQNWDAIKENQEGRRPKDSQMDKVPKHLPPLEKALQMQKKAAKVGFDWPSEEPIWDKIQEEINETKEALITNDQEKIEDELGDILFSVVNIARFHKIDPTLALNRSLRKFENRFRFIESKMKEKNLIMNENNFELMDSLWEDAKNL